jgi:hypothetical protein
VSCSIRLPNTSGVIDRRRKWPGEGEKEAACSGLNGVQSSRSADDVETCVGRSGMYPVRTYLCPRVREGLWLQIPTVDGFVIRVVESCRNQGRRRT